MGQRWLLPGRGIFPAMRETRQGQIWPMFCRWAHHISRVSTFRWWVEYADRKNDEEDEHVADSLLYDKRHLPRTAPAPEGVMAAIAADIASAKSRAALTLTVS